MGLSTLLLQLTFALFFFLGSGQKTASTSKIGESIQEVAICPALAVADIPSMPKCIEEFMKDLDEWSGLKTGQRSRSMSKVLIDVNVNIPEFTVCCALSKLRYCILDDIQSICSELGNKAIAIANQMSFKSVNFFTNILTNISSSSDNLDCDLDAWHYDTKNLPLCWSIWDQVIGIFFFLLLFFGIVYSSCVLAQRKNQDRGQSDKGFVPLTLTWNEAFRFRKTQNPPYY